MLFIDDSSRLIYVDLIIVRLSGLRSYSGLGMVEISHSRVWGTVCDHGWDINDAEVICRQLGYSGAKYALHGLNGSLWYGLTWLDNVNCSGSESSIWNCRHDGWGIHHCSRSELAGVHCLPRGKVLTKCV